MADNENNLLVTGKWGELHVTSEQTRAYQAGIVGAGRYVFDGFGCEMTEPNKAHVSGGTAHFDGAAVWLGSVGQDMTIENGEQGTNRNDLIVLRYFKDASGGNLESVKLTVVKGEPSAGVAADPDVNEGRIDDGNGPYDFPLWRIPIEGITVKDPVRLFEAINPLVDAIETGKTGIWNWAKTQSGVAMCWGSMTVLDTNITSPWGSLYYHGAWKPDDFPFAFVEAPNVYASPMGGNAEIISMVWQSAPSVKSFGEVYGLRPDSKSNVTYDVRMLAIGRWKSTGAANAMAAQNLALIPQEDHAAEYPTSQFGQMEAAVRMFVRAQAATLDDEAAASVSTFFDNWDEEIEYAKGDVRRHGGRLWRCAQGHTSQSGWEPENAPSLWYEVAYGADGILVWRPPSGAHDAPAKGDKRHYPDVDGAVYVSMRDGNTSVPGADEWWEAV